MYRTPPKYRLTPSRALYIRAQSRPIQSRHTSRIYGSRVHAHAAKYVRVTSGIQNSECATGCPLRAIHRPYEQR